jgi:6-pyruvoyltetrahydropterin/6-carboxytetrahydropterin synthase
MISVTRIHKIQTGHRVYRHEGHCKHLHGHSYGFEIQVTSEELDEVGRIIDFAIIRTLLCDWLDRQWDHRFLVWDKDPIWSKLIEIDPEGTVIVPFNPTVENIATYFVENISEGLLYGTNVHISELKVWETDKCAATYTNERYLNERTVGIGSGNMAQTK